MRRFCISALCASFPLFAHAQDQEERYFEFVGDIVEAPVVSGIATDDTEIMAANPDPGFLWWAELPPPLNTMFNFPDIPTNHGARDTIYAIEAKERSDEPCDLRVVYRNVNGDAVAVNNSDRFRECSNNSNNSAGTDGSKKEVSVSQREVATSVQICLNGDKMKGMVLNGQSPVCLTSIGADLPFCGSNDTTARDPRRDPPNFFERTNCPGSNDHKVDDDWGTEASVCPDVEITVLNQTRVFPTAMVGIELHLSETRNSKRRYVSGVRALCKQMTVMGARGGRDN